LGYDELESTNPRTHTHIYIYIHAHTHTHSASESESRVYYIQSTSDTGKSVGACLETQYGFSEHRLSKDKGSVASVEYNPEMVCVCVFVSVCVV
jgi:uncharacterized protein YhjY with autotransporter beta-barrel domain